MAVSSSSRNSQTVRSLRRLQDFSKSRLVTFRILQLVPAATRPSAHAANMYNLQGSVLVRPMRRDTQFRHLPIAFSWLHPTVQSNDGSGLGLRGQSLRPRVLRALLVGVLHHCLGISLHVWKDQGVLARSEVAIELSIYYFAYAHGSRCSRNSISMISPL